MGSMKEKMHTGELYLPGDPEIVEEQTKRLERLYDYNMTRPTEETKRCYPAFYLPLNHVIFS